MDMTNPSPNPNAVAQAAPTTPAVWTPPSQLAAMFSPQYTATLPNAAPEAGGVCWPFSRLKFNEFSRYQDHISVQEDMEENILCPSPGFRAPNIYIAPICGVPRHKTQRGGQYIDEFPGLVGACQYCPTSAPDPEAPDHCEDWIDMVYAVLGTCGFDPATRTLTGPSKLFGFYLHQAQKTSYQGSYNFLRSAIHGAAHRGVMPWATTYLVVLNKVKGKKGNFYNIVRHVRAEDNVQTATWAKDRVDPQSGEFVPHYLVMETPPALMAEINQRLVEGSIESIACGLLMKKVTDASGEIRDLVKRRRGGVPAPAFGAQPAFVPPGQTTFGAQPAFQGGAAPPPPAFGGVGGFGFQAPGTAAPAPAAPAPAPQATATAPASTAPAPWEAPAVNPAAAQGNDAINAFFAGVK